MTSIEGSLDESVEAFATLYAALDAPLADRRALLEAAGLDEDGFARLQKSWTERFAADMDGSGARFGEVCAAARSGGEDGAGPQASAATTESRKG